MDFFSSFGRSWDQFSHEKQTYKLKNLSLSGNEPNMLFRNDGPRFTRVDWVTGCADTRDARGFVPFDADRDGDLELFVTNNAQPAALFVNGLERAAPSRRWSAVALRGRRSNHFGIGARVALIAGGRRQVREVHAGSGFLSSPAPEAHFGLGELAVGETLRLEIRWPSGERTALDGLPADRLLVIDEDGRWQAWTPGKSTDVASR